MLSGFADFASEHLVNVAVQQNVGSLDRMVKGPREESLSKLSAFGNSYVADRGAFKLHSEGIRSWANSS